MFVAATKTYLRARAVGPFAPSLTFPLMDVEKQHESLEPPELPLSQRMLAASTGALLTALAVTPFDVVKTRMQVGAEPSSPKHPIGELASCPRCGVFVLNNGLMEHTLSKHDCAFFVRASGGVEQETAGATLAMLGRIGRTEGARGLYAGLGPTLMMAVPNTALYFTAYDELRKWLSGRVDAKVAPAVAGASARLVAATAVAPFELARTQLQALAVDQRRKFASHVFGVVRTDGLASLWRGLSPTLWRDVPFSAIYWAGYDFVGATFERRYPHNATRGRRLAKALVAGSCAGAFAALLTTPFDVVKTRRMVDVYVDGRPNGNGASTFALAADIARHEGPAALFTGAVPRLLKVSPACAIMIGTYEYAKALFERPPPYRRPLS